MDSKNVLLIENFDLDAILIMESLQQNGQPCNVYLLKQRGEIAAYLDNVLTPHSGEIPDLIIANEELIMLNGVNILAQIGKLSNYHIPVIILNSNGPNLRPLLNKDTCCFINKPLDVKEFMAVIKEIKYYWLCLMN